MPTVVSVAVIADKSTKDEFGPVVPENIIQDVSGQLYRKNLARVEIVFTCPNAGKEPLSMPITRDCGRIRFCEMFLWVKMPHLYDLKQFDSLLKVIVEHNIQGVTVNLIKGSWWILKIL